MVRGSLSKELMRLRMFTRTPNIKMIIREIVTTITIDQSIGITIIESRSITTSRRVTISTMQVDTTIAVRIAITPRTVMLKI